MRYAGKIILTLLMFVVILFPWRPASGYGIADISPTLAVFPKSACLETRGTVQSRMVPTTLLKDDIPVRVYTPPCYESASSMKYPVLYLLHGQSYKEDQWLRLGIVDSADELIQSGEINPLIIVMPGEAAYLEDMRLSRFDESILAEILPWVESTYRVVADREGRAIGGLSRGSGWAMHLGLSHPELFGSIGAHSLTQMAGDSYSMQKWRMKTPDELLPRIYIDIGLADPYKDTARSFELRLSEFSYPHEWHLNLGTHNEEYWSSHAYDYLRWYSAGWNLSGIVD